MPKSRNVFISYAREDRSKIEPIVSVLRAAGVNAWVDTLNIPAGANWQQEIDKGLENADALVYVASKNSTHSPWMNRELQRFLDRSKTVIPVIVDDLGEETLPESLRSVQWIDLRHPSGSQLTKLANDLPPSTKSKALEQAVTQSRGYVFLSYAAEDSTFIEHLRAFLAGRGYSYWDYQTGRRNYQVDYTIDLEERIQQAEALLAVISQNWKKSKTTLQELHFAKDVQKKVFLLRLGDPGPTLATAGMTYIDFSASREEGFSKLAREMADQSL
jgi:TIR domain